MMFRNSVIVQNFWRTLRLSRIPISGVECFIRSELRAIAEHLDDTPLDLA